MSEEKFDAWAVVEVMGHRVFAGRVTEQVIAGAGFVRVDVPAVDGRDAFTKMIGTGSIYCITPVSEDAARRAAAQHTEQPVHIWGPPSARQRLTEALHRRSDGLDEDNDGPDGSDDGPGEEPF